MAFRVDSSSSKTVLGLAAVAAIGLGTALFLRYRGNAAAQSTAPSLAQKGVSILRSLPGVGRAVNNFFPMKAAELPVVLMGSLSDPIGSVEELAEMLAEVKKQHNELGTLIIYGYHFFIYQDPGILALNPIKLVLVGVQIANSDEANSLVQCMIKKDDWINGVNPDFSGIIPIEVSSVDDALKGALKINTETNKPYHTAYWVRE